jgi:hypothetical protein
MELPKIGKNNNLSNFNRSSIVWFVIYIGIALAISFIVPFPLSLIVYIGVYLFLQSYRLKSIQNRLYLPSDMTKTGKEPKNKDQNKFLNSLSNSLFGDSNFSQFASPPLKFVCMNCGKEHSERICPVCGSTAVRLG